MNKTIKLINKVRIWAFIICFASGGSLVLGHFGHLGFDRILTGALWEVLETISRLSAVFAIVTTLIVLIDSAGNGLNTLQRKKDAKRDRKRH